MTKPLFALALGTGLFTAWGENARFQHQTIDDRIQIGYGLTLNDVNGDRKTDVLLVDKKQIVWYENPSWKKHVMVENLTKLDHVCIAAEDVDNDGKCDVAAGAGWNPGDTVGSGAAFFLMPATDRTQSWTPIPLHHEPTVHRMWWVRADGAGKRPTLIIAPLHGRGNKGGAGEGVKVLEYSMPEDPKAAWKTTLVDGSMHMTHNLDPVQWDNDEAEEILLCGKEGILVLDKAEGKWSGQQLINAEKNPGFMGAGEVRAGSFNGSRRFITTIEQMHGTNLVVYMPPEGGVHKTWKRKVIDSSLNDGHAIACGNISKAGAEGKSQIVAGWRGKNAEGKVGIKLYTADDNGQEWFSQWIDDNQMACEDLRLADLNGDGRLDIVAAGRATTNVKIYWNESGK